MKDLSSWRKNSRICLGINAIKSETLASLGIISREDYQINNEQTTERRFDQVLDDRLKGREEQEEITSFNLTLEKHRLWGWIYMI